MGIKKGKKKGSKGDDYWENEFEQDAELIQEDLNDAEEEPAAEESETRKPEASIDDDGEGLMAMMKKSQQKKNKKLEEETQQSGSTGLKSKKEKEKERKERQKLQKKKQPAQKKDINASQENADVIESKPAPSSPPEVSSAGGNAADKKKKKKGGVPVAALREFLAAKQAADEEENRIKEDAERAEQERLKKLEEEEAAKAEERRLKKEREKARKEQLRKEGKLVSDAEKKRRHMAQIKLESMRAAGMIVPALDGSAEGADKPKKKVVYDNKRKKKGPKDEKEKEQEPAVSIPTPEPEVEENKTPAAEEDVAESWEEVADSWEEIGEENDEPKSGENEDYSEDESTEDNNDTKKEDAPMDERTIQLKEAKEKREKRQEKARNARSKDNLRSPICVILGHVDTGKTKLLDKIRQTNVQEGEAGGITQQIGATYFPTESLVLKTEVIRTSKAYSNISDKTGFSQNFEFKVPGLLVIDTPGHESFTNLRSRGSSLCNIAILVVDIMHGLEPQTIESLNLLKARKTPFIVALNKIDRVYDWQSVPNNSFLDSYSAQNSSVKKEFEDRLEKTKVAFAEQGLNAELYYKNKDVRKYVSLVPTSAITGEGIPDLLSLLIQLTQNRLTETLMYLSELEATVLEVKVIEGHGTTIDVILSNGVLHEGDRIVICGLNGPIVTNIRALLTPQPMRELRVKSAYVHHKEIKAAMGVKIAAPDLEKAIAGSRLLVVTPEDDEEELLEEVMADLTDLFENVDKSGKGVCVQASTLGSLEALLSFLKDSKIPVAGINIGPIYKKDVLRASVMLESAKEFATILAFDVKVDKEAQEYADETGVKIFKADIIYHLFDWFTAYLKDIREERRKELAPKAIWPCWLKIVPGCIFNKKDPIILGVDILDGSLRIGTPVCVPGKGNILLGKVAGIEANHKPVEIAKKGQQVAVRIENPANDAPKIAGRHFMETDEIVSMISRTSIDVLKESFRDEVSKEEWLLIKKLKPLLNIE